MTLRMEVRALYSPLPIYEEIGKLKKKENVCQAFFCFLSQPFYPSACLKIQKRKEREEQLEDVIQAYEKIHMEKNNLQRDLNKMVRDVIQFAAPGVLYFTVVSHGWYVAR